MKRSWLVALVLAGGMALLVVAATVLGSLHSPAVAALRGVEFHFSSDFPAGDDSVYVMNGEGVEDFRALLDEFGVNPMTYVDPDDETCPGSAWVEIDATFAFGGNRHIHIDSCMTGEGSFEQRAVGLFGYFTLDHVAENYPNSAITSITFRQSQSVDGFDYSTYTQDDPEQIARFAAILDAVSLVWADRASFREPVAVDPCADAVVTHVTVSYQDVVLQDGPLAFDACRNEDALTQAMTSLFSEWRHDLSG